MEGQGESLPQLAVGGSIETPTRQKNRKAWRYAIIPAILLFGAVWVVNYLMIGQPISEKLSSDPRNSGYSISAHFQYYVDPSILVLDLRSVSAAAPLDLLRGVFESAETMSLSGHQFSRVVLERSGSPIFFLSGADFVTLGREYAGGQNPVYLIRTLPEKLYTMSGRSAFGRWEGGLIGVLGKQMEDVAQAAREWAESH